MEIPYLPNNFYVTSGISYEKMILKCQQGFFHTLIRKFFSISSVPFSTLVIFYHRFQFLNLNSVMCNIYQYIGIFIMLLRFHDYQEDHCGRQDFLPWGHQFVMCLKIHKSATIASSCSNRFFV